MRISSNAFISATFCICIGLSGLAHGASVYSDSSLYRQKNALPLAAMSGMMAAGSFSDLLIPLAGLRAFIQNWWIPPVEDHPPVEQHNEFETFLDRLQRLTEQYPDKDMDEIWQMALDEEEQSFSHDNPELPSRANDADKTWDESLISAARPRRNRYRQRLCFCPGHF